jgi:hypothetical protein
VLNFPHGEVRSVIIKVQHNCTSDRKRYGRMEDVPIRHEYCIVFKKTQSQVPVDSQRKLLAVEEQPVGSASSTALFSGSRRGPHRS